MTRLEAVALAGDEAVVVQAQVAEHVHRVAGEHRADVLLEAVAGLQAVGAGADLEVAAVGEGIAVQAVGHQQFAGLGAQLDPRLLRVG
ncbi:hypothetical protein D3C78_1027690 [compost metagenome]